MCHRFSAFHSFARVCTCRPVPRRQSFCMKFNPTGRCVKPSYGSGSWTRGSSYKASARQRISWSFRTLLSRSNTVLSKTVIAVLVKVISSHFQSVNVIQNGSLHRKIVLFEYTPTVCNATGYAAPQCTVLVQTFSFVDL